MKNESAVMNLYDHGIYSATEISRILNIGNNRVWDVLIKHGIRRKDLDELNKLNISSKLQEEVLIGTIIGDGSLIRQNKTAVKCRMSLAHSMKQKEYFLKKYEISLLFLLVSIMEESAKIAPFLIIIFSNFFIACLDKNMP